MKHLFQLGRCIYMYSSGLPRVLLQNVTGNGAVVLSNIEADGPGRNSQPPPF